ncbi:MAG: NAD(+) diphosphatase [Hyphomicrobiaceae bacterium]|nr:NAD(+) diphosphatase [Hyphomicrobiaceae bacterium]
MGWFADLPPEREPSRQTGFSGNRLDRLSERRLDADFVVALRQRADARFALFCGDRPLIAIDAHGGLDALHGLELALALGADPAEMALLGLETDGEAAGAPRFAALLDRPVEAIEAEAIAVGAPVKAIDLRSLVVQGVLPADVMGLLAQARSITHWHASHRFCSKCGTASQLAQAGYRRDCPACGAQHFPRTDPVAIMLTVYGDRCLLGRQPHFPEGMYSCLAGFIEPGETAEAAVRRETMEESGIRVGRVAYHASQPWPFPASLMLGFLAEAVSTEIRRDETELEDVRWFPRAEVAAMLAKAHPHGLFVPPGTAVAQVLIRHFVQSGG